MGIYLNPDNEDFTEILDSPTYVDKSGLISLLNPRISRKSLKYLCVSRARRFGKTWTADMLKAYYSLGCDSRALFEKLAVAADPSFAEHLNAYDVVHMDMAKFYLAADKDVGKTIRSLTEEVANEIYRQYPDVLFGKNKALNFTLGNLFAHTHRKIIFIVDEWDHILRDRRDKTSQKQYLEFVRLLFRDQSYVGLCYMTGILPIRKYDGQSGLGFFQERSMIRP
ncbi:MAG: AAA family ATPase, partial [Deltaproteobacteria bacterium]|nr:AAA family ATPase [Deltaproteobacteria bacterium]